ncbi:glycosyltransferase family 2 protein [Actinomycetes bacterium KLBMP 9759]
MSVISSVTEAQDAEQEPVRDQCPAVSVVVPCRNEARSLELVLPAIAAVRPAVHEVVLVDGHSTDDSLDVAVRALPDVLVVQQTRRGKGNALVCGFAAATGDVIVVLDADGTADPAEIPAFVDALVAGADFAKGSRFTAGGGSDPISTRDRLAHSTLNTLANALLGTTYSDLCYGYNAFWADVLPRLHLPPVDMPVDEVFWGDGPEIVPMLNCRAVAAGLVVADVPSVERQRLFGDPSRRSLAERARILRTLLAEHRRVDRRRGPVGVVRRDG